MTIFPCCFVEHALLRIPLLKLHCGKFITHLNHIHTHCRIIRGWYPLTLDKSISWMVYLQVRLKLQDLHIETLQTAESGSAGGSVGGSVSGGSGGMGLRGLSSVGLSDVGGISTGPNTPVPVSTCQAWCDSQEFVWLRYARACFSQLIIFFIFLCRQVAEMSTG